MILRYNTEISYHDINFDNYTRQVISCLDIEKINYEEGSPVKLHHMAPYCNIREISSVILMFEDEIKINKDIVFNKANSIFEYENVHAKVISITSYEITLEMTKDCPKRLMESIFYRVLDGNKLENLEVVEGDVDIY